MAAHPFGPYFAGLLMSRAAALGGWTDTVGLKRRGLLGGSVAESPENRLSSSFFGPLIS